uniref:NADH dehydrogenase subunit 3 n=1 Tax=Dinobdella ferox TaxID=755736 RepID=UPI0023D87458|nr:NADH dehydrogenase subunit 3 [Dinobdella ferox]WDA96083.1 NADH dehydrogenase subunit 3 [Dinobdella ferox]
MILFSISTIICIILPLVVYLLSWVIYFRLKLNRQKNSAFECGFDSLSNARIPFSTRFFLLGIIFIVFDIEIVLLLPIPIISMKSSLNLVMFLMVILILIIGLIHEWNEGSIDWSM